MSFNISYIFEIQDKMTAQLNQISGKMDKFNDAIQKQNNQFKKLNETTNRHIDTVKRLAGAYLTFEGGRRVINVLKDFDTALLGIKANADGLTADTFQALKDQAITLGTTTEFTATQVANGMVDLAKAGLKANEIIEATPAILDSATAAGVGFESASSMLVSSISALGRKMEEIPRLADLTAKAANISNASFGDIAMAISRGGSAAFEFNTNIEETYAAMAILSESLMSGERAGSSFRSMLRELGVYSKQGAEALAQYGLTYDDINPKTNKLNDIIAKLQPLLKDTNAAYKLLGDEGKVAGVMLAANAEKFNSHTKALENSTGSAKGMAEVMRSGLKGSIDNLFSAIEGLIIKLGDAGLTNAIKSVTNVLTAFTRVLSDPIFINIVVPIGKIAAEVWLLSKAFMFLGGTATLQAIRSFSIMLMSSVTLGSGLTTLRIILLSVATSMRAVLLANPFTAILVGALAFYELIKKIPAIMEAIYNKFAFVRSIGNFLTGGLDESQQLQRPKSILGSEGGMSIMEQVAQNKAGGQFQGNMNINFNNIPKGTNIETTTKGADYMKLGVNSAFAI